MVFKAIYVGKKLCDEKERLTQDGEVIPAFKGVRYSFYLNEWEGDIVQNLFGRTYTDKRDEQHLIRAIEDGEVQLGDVVDVSVRQQDLNFQYVCKYIE